MECNGGNYLAKHNDNRFKQAIKNENKMRAVFTQGLQDQLRSGIAQGTYAACKVMYDKAMDTTKGAEERLNDIIAFCKPVIEAVTKAKENTKAG